jgi:hypothetical protein
MTQLETNGIVDESEQKEVLYEIRVDMAFDAWKRAAGTISLRKAARMHGISYHTVRGRSKGAVSRKQHSQDMQRLSVQEEGLLRKWVLQLGAWGWPPLISQLYRMASELCKSNGDNIPLGINWPQHFLCQHPDL